MSFFDEFEQFQKFQDAWSRVRIERPVECGLFTFGDSDLPYFLVTRSSDRDELVRIRQGQVTVTRPRIITPESLHPEFQNFFDDSATEGFAAFLMSRTAAFSSLKLSNQSGPDKIVTDTIEEAVDRLNRQLDSEGEDRVAILSAPAEFAGFALLKYAADKVMSSAPDNIQELRGRGFLR